jgi:hypothetical protein
MRQQPIAPGSQSPLTAQQAACLSLLLYGESGNSAARVLRVTSATVSVWRRKLEALGLIGPPDPGEGGRPRGARGARRDRPEVPPRSGARDGDALGLPPGGVEWLERGWGEYHEREWAAREAGADFFSR